jgi:hypothetical protein
MDERCHRSETEKVDLSSSLHEWHTDGFVLLPGYLSAAQIQPGISDLRQLFPTADEFHGAADLEESVRFKDEFGGIDDFPFMTPFTGARPSANREAPATHSMSIFAPRGRIGSAVILGRNTRIPRDGMRSLSGRRRGS